MDKLIEYLDRHSISQSELARRLEVSKTIVSLWVSGKRLPSPKMSLEIAEITNNEVPAHVLRPDIFKRFYDISNH